MVLGKGAESGHQYATRYVIRRKQQREELCGEVIRETFAPCSYFRKMNVRGTDCVLSVSIMRGRVSLAAKA